MSDRRIGWPARRLKGAIRGGMLLLLAVSHVTSHKGAGGPLVEHSDGDWSTFLPPTNESASSGELDGSGGLEIGSYLWCHSRESDFLCDTDWNDICGNTFDNGAAGHAQRRIIRDGAEIPHATD
jgi:hypothetical protein